MQKKVLLIVLVLIIGLIGGYFLQQKVSTKQEGAVATSISTKGSSKATTIYALPNGVALINDTALATNMKTIWNLLQPYVYQKQGATTPISANTINQLGSLTKTSMPTAMGSGIITQITPPVQPSEIASCFWVTMCYPTDNPNFQSCWNMQTCCDNNSCWLNMCLPAN